MEIAGLRDAVVVRVAAQELGNIESIRINQPTKSPARNSGNQPLDAIKVAQLGCFCQKEASQSSTDIAKTEQAKSVLSHQYAPAQNSP
jgi:hypothetical protein